MSKEKEINAESVLEDTEIIELYWERNEKAISETDKKYRRYLFTIAFNILNNSLDCDECLNDTYLGTWNTIPPQRPSVFQMFLSKIMRNTALVRYKYNTAKKRVPSEMSRSLDELDGCIPHEPSVEEAYFTKELSRLLSNYLRSLPERSAFVFICRYYCSDKVSDIAEMLHVSESTVFREITSIKNGLREFLEKEGYRYE